MGWLYVSVSLFISEEIGSFLHKLQTFMGIFLGSAVCRLLWRSRGIRRTNGDASGVLSQGCCGHHRLVGDNLPPSVTVFSRYGGPCYLSSMRAIPVPKFGLRPAAEIMRLLLGTSRPSVWEGSSPLLLLTSWVTSLSHKI